MTNKFQQWKGIMKCYPFEEKRLAKWEPPYIVQPKYDGFRCRAQFMEHSGCYMLLSSGENPFFSVPHILQVLDMLGLKAHLDGELYCHGMSFEEIESIASRTVNLHPDHKKLSLHVFDLVNKEPQMRRTLLVEALSGLHPLIQVAPFYLCETLDDVKRAYDALIKLGYEGIIVRHKLAMYETKRSTWVMKFKPKKHDTYIITGWNEEMTMDGVPKGRIGSLVFSSQTGDVFSASAGLDDISKSVLWDIRDLLPGKSATIHYQHLTNKKIPKGTFNIEVHDV